MSPNPTRFIEHLRQLGYHPRSDKHSNVLAECIVTDLIQHCKIIRDKAANGELVYDLNFDLIVGRSTWNVDLVIGAPQLGAQIVAETGIVRSRPASVEIAIELKTVMTEHRKAVKNRKRDLEAHHEHVHNYYAHAIAGGVFVINAAETFKSPLRGKEVVTVHKNPLKLVEHCISELRSVSARGGPTGYGLEAQCAIVVAVSNMEVPAEYIVTPPAPQVGDPLHYDSFIRRMCDAYQQRFAPHHG